MSTDRGFWADHGSAVLPPLNPLPLPLPKPLPLPLPTPLPLPLPKPLPLPLPKPLRCPCKTPSPEHNCLLSFLVLFPHLHLVIKPLAFPCLCLLHPATLLLCLCNCACARLHRQRAPEALASTFQGNPSVASAPPRSRFLSEPSRQARNPPSVPTQLI